MHGFTRALVVCVPLLLTLAIEVRGQIDLLAGAWKVNLAKSTYEPGPPPTIATTITYRKTAEGYDWFTGELPPLGQPSRGAGAISFDGRFRRVTGVRNYDEIAFTPRDAFTTEVTRRRAGNVVQTGLRVLSSDGSTLTITFDGTDADGKTIHEKVVYEKQR